MKQGLKRLAEEHGASAGFLASLIAIIAIPYAVIKVVFAVPDLSIVLETTPLRLPVYIVRDVADALAKDSASFSDSTGRALRRVRGFLRDTETFTVITLRNNSATSLENLDLRLRNVGDADGYAVDGDGLTASERVALVEKITFDYSSRMLILRDIPRLPPQSELKVYVWGDVREAALFGESQLTVTYDGGYGEIQRVSTVRGVDSYIFENSSILVIVFVIANLAAWRTYRLRGRDAAT